MSSDVVSQIVFRVMCVAASISAWQLRWNVRTCFREKPQGGEQPPPVRVSIVTASAAAAASTGQVLYHPLLPPCQRQASGLFKTSEQLCQKTERGHALGPLL